MENSREKLRAFTMLELIFVIIVLGILAALAIPRLKRDTQQEAVTNVLSAIRYARYMAMNDNVIQPTNNNWQRAFWRIGFEKCSDNGMFYYIASDKDLQGDIDAQEVVNDPANGKPMMGDNSQPCATQIQSGRSPNIFITRHYGISDPNGITFAADCGVAVGKYIGFDHLGRPHRGYAGNAGSTTPDYSTLLTQDCHIIIHFDDNSIQDTNITIEKTTGHAYWTEHPEA